MSIKDENYNLYKSFFDNDPCLKEIESLIWMTKDLYQIDENQLLKEKLTDNLLYSKKSTIRTDVDNISDNFIHEMKKNIGYSQNIHQVLEYLRFVHSENITIEENFYKYFRVEWVNIVQEINWESRDEKVYRLMDVIQYIHRTIDGLTHFIKYEHDSRLPSFGNIIQEPPKVFVVKETLDSFAQTSNTQSNSIEVNYFVDEGIILKLYKKYNGIWWQKISLEDIFSCF